MSKKDKQNSTSLPIHNSFFSILKETFEVKKRPFPWSKAINAGICGGFPIVFGLLINRLDLGLLGGMGTFAYLYNFNEPYAIRAKKIFFAALGISCAVGLGTLSAPYPLLSAVMVGLIMAIVTFIFGTLKLAGPAAIFFVLSFLMATGMPVDQSAAPLRFSIVFLSGCFSWVMSMKSCFFKRHNPEIKTLKGVYSCLAEFCEAIGSENVNDVRQSTVNALSDAEDILLSGYISWKNSFLFNRLSLLNEQANSLFLEMLELSFDKDNKLPIGFSELIRQLSVGIESKDGEIIEVNQINKKEINKKYHKFLEIIYDAEAIINLPLENIGRSIIVSKPSLKMKLIKACDKDSIIFVNAVRSGIILTIASIISYKFGFSRAYWIPLSCTSAMMGATIIGTFHRAVQRTIGTLVGLILAIYILSLQPKGLLLIIICILLTGITELFIVKNYALAVIFITPNALLIAETATKTHDFSYFATARVTDILVGVGIGLIGTYIMGHNSASSRLPGLMTKLIRSQARVLVRLSSDKIKDNNNDISWIKEKLQINLNNLKIAYTTALGEIPSNKEMLEIMWPAVFTLEHITYLLDKCCATEEYLNLSDEELGQLLLVLETMATAIEQKQLIQPKNLPIIDAVPKLCKEINQLQEALSIEKIYA